jgi:hypothetical protein
VLVVLLAGNGIGPAVAVAASTDSLSGLDTVVRVKYSLDSVAETINSSGDAGTVVAQIERLLNNYQFKDNLKKAIELVPPTRLVDARSHAAVAEEDLRLVTEYFEDNVDNMSGTRRPPRELLQFSSQAYHTNMFNLFYFGVIGSYLGCNRRGEGDRRAPAAAS